MAAPSYTTDLVDVNASAESTTSWSALGGGGAGLSADVDFAIEGTNSMTKQVSNALKGMIYDYGSTRTQATDDHIYQWIFVTTPGLLDTLANGGIRITVGTGTGAYNEYYIRGATEYAEGGWICEPIRYTTSTPSPGSQTGTPGAAPQWFGGQCKTTASVKAVNFSVDACYEGSNITITAGDVTTPGTYERLTTWAYDKTRRYPVVLPIAGGAAVQGKLYWGSGSTSVYVRDSGKLVTFPDTPHSLTSLSEIHHQHASTDAEFLGFTFLALGTNNRGAFICDATTNPLVDYTGSTFIGTNTFNARSNTTLDDCFFIGCNGVNAGNGASLLRVTYDKPTVATDGAALVWNDASDPSGNIDGSTFIKGTNAHHAIEFGTSAPTTMTITDCTFTGFSGTGTSATFNFLRTSGTTTVNYTGTLPTAQVTGTHTVTFVQSNTLTVNIDQDVNTEIRVYDAGTTTHIAGIENIGATKTWNTSIDSATYPSVDVAILSTGYINEYRASVDMSAGDVTIDIQQRTDRQFDNP